MQNINHNTHRRRNPLTGEWVLVSTHRMERPWKGQLETTKNIKLPEYDSNCYLCPGNKRAGGKVNPDYSGTFVFQNDFPALIQRDEKLDNSDNRENDLFRSMEVSGACRVICFSPSHSKTLPELKSSEILQVVKAWKNQTLELGENFRWVQIFENKGEVMGCSNPHPHSQVWATNVLPTEVEKEEQRQKKYYRDYGQSLLKLYAQNEIYSASRIVEQNSSWLAVVPYWATWPFEILLMPLRSVQRLSDLNKNEQVELSEILKLILTRYDNLFETSFPYSMGWHGAPLKENSPHWQLHAHFYPPLLRSSNVKKFMVGYELLAESQRDLTPEQSAKRLRDQAILHYRQSL